MTEQEVLEILEECGAIMHGHFRLSSGRHSDTYAEKFRALEVPSIAQRLGAAIAKRSASSKPDVVLSPAIGAIVLGFAAAAELGCRFIFAEREGGEMKLRRGFHIDASERVLVVEDVVTTGKSLREVLALVPDEQLVATACLIDRSGGSEPDLRLQALARLDVPSWPAEECPLCAEGIAVDSPGSRHLMTG